MIKVTTSDIGGKDPVLPGSQIASNRTNLDDLANLRDSVSALVAAGYTGKTSDPELAAHRDRIIRSLPQGQAQNLLTHISVQNSTPGFSIMSPEQRIGRFYDINSSVPATDDLLRRIKSFGTGPMSSFKDSQDVLLRKLAGSDQATPIVVRK